MSLVVFPLKVTTKAQDSNILSFGSVSSLDAEAIHHSFLNQPIVVFQPFFSSFSLICFMVPRALIKTLVAGMFPVVPHL
jgi:hypothetical protein